MILFGIDIRIYFLLFIIYSIAGWILEVVGKLIENKRFINRGFLIGPYCPIYGCGSILITFLLKKYTDDPLALFIMAIVVCGILEYLTSYFMETIFKARWWDYSQRKFNINGRVCLYTIIPFGILGLFIMYVSNPFLLEKLEIIPQNVLTALFWISITLFILDVFVSTIVIKYVKKTEKSFSKYLDNTEEITKKVKEVLKSKSIFHRRLLYAYPNFEAVKIKIKETKEQIEKKVKKETAEISKKVENTTKTIEQKVKNIKKDNENIKNN